MNAPDELTDLPDHTGDDAALPVPAEEETLALPDEYPGGAHELMPGLGAGDTPAKVDGDEDADETPARTKPAESAPDLRDIPIADLHEIANIRPQYYGLEDLCDSMRVQGQLEAAMVRPAPPGALHDKPWELVFGYRRKRAAETLGWEHLRCEVRDLANANVLDVMITENLQREDLSAIAEAKAMKAMVELGGMSQAAVAQRLGKDPSHVSHRLQLLGLSAPVMEQIDKGEISASHGEVIASLPEAQQEQFAAKAAKGNISVSKLTSWVRKAKQEAEEAPPDDPEDLMPVTADDVVQIPHVALRHDLDADDITRLITFVLLRSANDQEMLEYLEDTYELPYEGLWPWVAGLSADDAAELSRRLVRRYVEAGHRYGSIDPQLIDDLGDTAVAEGRATYAPTPSLTGGDIELSQVDTPTGWLPPAGFGANDADQYALPAIDDGSDPWAPALPPASDGEDDPADENPWEPAASPTPPEADENLGAESSALGPLPYRTSDDDAPEAETDGPDVAPDEAPTDDESEDVDANIADDDDHDDTPIASADDAPTDMPAPAAEAEAETDPSADIAARLTDALVAHQADLDAEKGSVIAARVGGAGETLGEIAHVWMTTGEFPAAPTVGDVSPALLGERMGKPSLVFSALCALHDDPERARPALARFIDTEPASEPFSLEQVASALVARQGLDADKSRAIALRVEGADRQVQDAAMDWVRDGDFPDAPRIAGQTPSSLAAHLQGKPSLVLGALVALRENPALVLERLGLNAPE